MIWSSKHFAPLPVVSKRLNESSRFWHGGFHPHILYCVLCYMEIRVSSKIRYFSLELYPKLWTGKISQGKSILLSTELVDGRACWQYLRRSTHRGWTHAVYCTSVDRNVLTALLQDFDVSNCAILQLEHWEFSEIMLTHSSRHQDNQDTYGDEHVDDGLASVHDGHEYGRGAAVRRVSQLHVGALVHQELHHARAADARRLGQRRTAARTHLVHVRSCHHLFTHSYSDSLATLVYAVVNSRMHYCNTVLAGAPRTVTDKLQHMLNAAARVITGTRKRDRGLGQTNCIDLTFPTGFSSSLQWQFTSVWTAVHHRICRSTASRSPVLTSGGICIPPTITYLPYRVSGSTLTAIGPSQLLTQWPGSSRLELTPWFYLGSNEQHRLFYAST